MSAAALRTLALFLPALLLCACGEDAPTTTASGVYLLDVDATTAVLGEQGIPAAEARRQAAAGRVRLDLQADRTFTLILRSEHAGPERWTGRWAQTGAQLVLTTTERLGKALEPPDVVNGVLEDGRLRLEAASAGPAPMVLRPE